MLEEEVDEKYYLSDKQLTYILDGNDVALKSGRNINDRIINPQITKTISCRGAADQRADVTNFVIDNEENEITVKEAKLRIKNATKQVYLEATDNGGKDRGVCVGTYQYAKSDKFMNGKDRLQLGKDTSDTLQTTPKEGVCYNDLRIRKLTPRECGRLMGVKDKDITNMLKNQSNSSAYHCFGDSIICTVLCAIFGELLNIDYKNLIESWNYNE